MPERPRWKHQRIRVGEWTITPLLDGSLRLDGGSMWGVVPAVIWRPLTPPAADNTIPQALRPFLAERGDARVLIEVGIGDRWETKQRRMYQIDRTDSLDETLKASGVSPDEITHVVASHCHWDHIGSQVVEENGRLRPHFPNARHFAPRIEVEAAQRTGGVRSPSYRADDVTVVEESGQLTQYEGGEELLPGLRVHVVAGHSEGVALITLGEDQPGETAVFWSDVVPTTHHIQPRYIMAYDIDATRSFEVRSHWIGKAADEGWIGLFYHDIDHAVGRIVRDGRRFAFEAL